MQYIAAGAVEVVIVGWFDSILIITITGYKPYSTLILTTYLTTSTARAATAPAAIATPTEPFPYAYSTGNGFATFAKPNGKNYFAWRRKVITQLCALSVNFIYGTPDESHRETISLI